MVKAQGWLPFVPEDLAGLGLKGCDRAPRCSKGREASFRDVRRRPGPVAWTLPHVQHHGTNDYTGVYLDVDRPAEIVYNAQRRGVAGGTRGRRRRASERSDGANLASKQA